MRTPKIIKQKLNAVLTGEKPRVLDLFGGCGGMSLGFHAAGFDIRGTIEMDPHAARSHAINFHNGSALHSAPVDITGIEPQEFADRLGLGDVGAAFDIVIGGPPCQAYARVGRAKLRDVAAHPHAFKEDPRGNLYLRYLHFVEHAQPLAIVVENVPDILNYGGTNVMQEIADALKAMGYVAKYSLLNTAFYGVPQMRDRVFLIAVHRSVASSVTFPSPTRYLNLPSGYEGTRAVAYKLLQRNENCDFVQAEEPSKNLPGPVTAQEAIGDLPQILGHLDGTITRGARRFDKVAPYPPLNALSDYARSMREWPGFEARVDGPVDHVIRSLPRDTPIFKEMPNGGEYPAAHATAVRMYEKRKLAEEKKRRRKLREDEAKALFRSIVPPHPVATFPNRWWKLRQDFPSRTLLAHMGKDTYSHIHYDSDQARVVSVREAARLQSFPDGFVFSGTMNPAFKQIGNAVPPVMSNAIASHVMQIIKGIMMRDQAA